MSRWRPNTRQRLEKAAFELFQEKGFNETTVPEIAQRADLTTRTFFRHFPDKREALFAVSDNEPSLFTELDDTLLLNSKPADLIEAVLDVVAKRLENQYDYLKARHKIIQSDRSLVERELYKLDIMADKLTQDAVNHGIDKPTASLMAKFGISIVNTAVNEWLESENKTSLPGLVTLRINMLKSMFS
jgi:AcrR family transcriptional regulator